jgi:hypothetical protein
VVVYCLILFVAGVTLSWFYSLKKESGDDAEVCSASVVVYHNNIRANLTLDFMYNLNEQAGVVTVNGTYSKDDKVIGAIRRDVSYIWTENKDSSSFTSVKVNNIINDDSVSDEAISELLPDFYIYPEKNVVYSVLPQGSDSFMFSVGKRPVFLCYR